MADTSEIYARMAWEVLKRLLTSAHTVQSLADLTCIPVRRVRYLAEDPTKFEVEDYGRPTARRFGCRRCSRPSPGAEP